MIPPDEMASMQSRLDEDRAALSDLRSYIEQNFMLDAGDGRLRFSELAQLYRNMGYLIELDEYRARLAGRPGGDDLPYGRFEQLRRLEERLRGRVSVGLGHLVECAEENGAEEMARFLDAELAAFSGLPVREKELYDARLDWARLIVAQTKSAIEFGASNQILDIASSGGQSLHMIQRVQDHSFALPLPPGDGSLALGQRAAIAEHFKTGNCTEQSWFAATEAFQMLPGTEISVMNHRSDHSYLVIGPPGFLESAYVDTWPRKPTVANFDEYGLQPTSETRLAFRGVADGRNLREEARPYIRKLPDRPSPLPPMEYETAVQAVRRAKIADQVFHIVRTTDHSNSDSDSEPEEFPGRGHTLSEAAFAATAAPGVRSSSPAVAGHSRFAAPALAESLTWQARSGPVSSREAAEPRLDTASPGPSPAGRRAAGTPQAISPTRARPRGR
ncbi:hypothetical protein OG215_38320 (plasmid) [Streptomyces globisporus]|uniref:hypothetical protein n=1 Tax=Streptomyces globisporus TaxID=1908 RepID=UPI002F909C20|nr:hypothetical protein OG215_38320 [Streptomyces globisporus]